MEWLHQLAATPTLRPEYVTTLRARIEIERGYKTHITQLLKLLEETGDEPTPPQLFHIRRRVAGTQELNRSLAVAFPKWDAHSRDTARHLTPVP